MIPEPERFTDDAQRLVTFADHEARRLGHARLGTEHLLLGLLRDGDGIAAKALAGMGIHLANARSTVEYILGRIENRFEGDLRLSGRASKVIHLASEEADALGQGRVAPEHLLLGILREGQGIPVDQGRGIAAGVIEALGVDLESVRQHVLRRING